MITYQNASPHRIRLAIHGHGIVSAAPWASVEIDPQLSLRGRNATNGKETPSVVDLQLPQLVPHGDERFAAAKRHNKDHRELTPADMVAPAAEPQRPADPPRQAEQPKRPG